MKKTFNKKALLLLFFICLFVGSANALVWEGENIRGINYGYGYGGILTEGDQYVIHNGSAVFLFEGNAKSLLIIPRSTHTINDAVVGSDGKLYISTNYGIVVRDNTYTTPVPIITGADETWEGYTKSCTLLSSDTPNKLSVDGRYIYYAVGMNVFRIDTRNMLSSKYYEIPIPDHPDIYTGAYDSHQNHIVQDLFVRNGDLYYIYARGFYAGATSQRINNVGYTYYLFKNDDLIYIIKNTSGSGGNRFRSSYLQLLDENRIYYYIYGYTQYQIGYNPRSYSTYRQEVLKLNNSVYEPELSGDIPKQAVSPYFSMNSLACIGTVSNTMLMTDGVDLHLVASEYIGLDPSSSSGSSGTDNPTNFGDSHEWTNDEIATSARQIVPPIFFMVLLFFFLFAIGGN